MSGVWSTVLPYALAAAACVALLRPRYLRALDPGIAISQRLGLFIATAPFFLLIFIGFASIPDLGTDRTIAALPPDQLADKAVAHLGLYLGLPVVGLMLILGPRETLRAALLHLFDGPPSRAAFARGLSGAASVSLAITALLMIGWAVLPDGTTSLFAAADGARVFFSNTTAGVALLLAAAAAVAEEALFRGVLLSHLRRSWNVHAAIGIQAGLFGLIHAGYGSVTHVFAAAAFGVLMGYMVLRSGLLPAIIVHFLVNTVILASWSPEGGHLVPIIVMMLALLAGVWAVRGLSAVRDARAQAA